MKRFLIVVALMVLMLMAAAMPAEAARLPDSEHGGLGFDATLTGAAEVPGPGDADGSGTADITLNYGQREVCWALEVADIAQATAAHIHRGTADVAGPVVVPLSAPGADGTSTGCATASRELIDEIRDNPSGFYVNVHNTDFPGGAIRGQLGR